MNSSEFQDSASFIVILDAKVRQYSEIDGLRLPVNTTYLVTSLRLRTDSSLFFRDVFSSWSIVVEIVVSSAFCDGSTSAFRLPEQGTRKTAI